MSGGRKRSLIPVTAGSPKDWEQPDISNLSEDHRKLYSRRREAVLMHAAGKPVDAMTRTTGFSYAEIRRLVKRCVEFKAVGVIWGFEALMPGRHVKGYTRSASSSERDPDKVRADAAQGVYDKEIGFAGALHQLLARFPAIEDVLRNELRLSKTVRDVHARFLEAATANGVSQHEWPFNTSRQGYNAIASFAKWFRGQDERAFAAGFGKQAALNRRLDPAGERIFPDLRCMAQVQLDYHKIDAASIIEMDIGKVKHDIVVPRWYVGVLAEVSTSAILGLMIALESNPSSLSFLETIESALFGLRDTNDTSISTSDNLVLINSFLPEAKDCCFSVLEVDNAWANLANDSINNVLEVTGAAIRVGKPYQWWGRALVENLIGRLTSRGAKTLPSSFGSGPTDPMRDAPDKKALKLRITVDDLIATVYEAARAINTMPTSTNRGNSPLQAVKSAFEHPSSGVFPQPLPESDLPRWLLMATVEERTVKGDPSKGRSCYVNVFECRFTHKRLTENYDLLDEVLVLYINKKNANQIFGVVKKTGEKIGLFQIEHAKRSDQVTVAERKRENSFRKGKQAVEDARVTEQSIASARTRAGKNLLVPAEVLQMVASRYRKSGSATKPGKPSKPNLEVVEKGAGIPLIGLGADPFGLSPKLTSLRRNK